MLHGNTALDGAHQVPPSVGEAGDAARLVLEGRLYLLVHLLGGRQVEHLHKERKTSVSGNTQR